MSGHLSFGMVDAGLPRRVSCFAAAQAGHEAESRAEANALANSGCLIACLTARTVAPGPREGYTGVAGPPHTGVYPCYRAGQGAITRRVCLNGGPLYPPNGDRQNRRLRKLICSAPRSG